MDSSFYNDPPPCFEAEPIYCPKINGSIGANLQSPLSAHYATYRFFAPFFEQKLAPPVPIFSNASRQRFD